MPDRELEELQKLQRLLKAAGGSSTAVDKRIRAIEAEQKKARAAQQDAARREAKAKSDKEKAQREEREAKKKKDAAENRPPTPSLDELQRELEKINERIKKTIRKMSELYKQAFAEEVQKKELRRLAEKLKKELKELERRLQEAQDDVNDELDWNPKPEIFEYPELKKWFRIFEEYLEKSKQLEKLQGDIDAPPKPKPKPAPKSGDTDPGANAPQYAMTLELLKLVNDISRSLAAIV